MYLNFAVYFALLIYWYVFSSEDMYRNPSKFSIYLWNAMPFVILLIFSVTGIKLCSMYEEHIDNVHKIYKEHIENIHTNHRDHLIQIYSHNQKVKNQIIDIITASEDESNEPKE